MRKRLLILALLLTLLYLVGGSEALTDAISKLFVLAGLQVITSLVEEQRESQRMLKNIEPRRLKKRRE